MMRPLPKTRGFVLIVALLLAVATAAVAVGLIQAGGQANVAVAHSNAGEAARALAEAGMARAEAYALTISRPRDDFDLVLDPLREADCSNLEQVTDSGAVPETGSMYIPRFTDTGTSIVTYEGLRWRMVPYNGGAYLVRFSDNFDDGPAAPGPFPAAIDWTSSTSNTRTGSPGDNGWCAEGPDATTAAPIPGIAGVNNPARDRDRTITINVVGIFPGTNPTAAKHRTMLSKVLMDGRVKGPAGMRVGGNITTASGARAQFCSEVSGVASTGIIDDGPPGSCGCGTVQATTVDLTNASCGACCGSNTYEEVDGATVTPPTVPVSRAPDWYDYTSSCNFYMDPATMSLYFWDAAGSRGGSACNAWNGNLPTPSRASAAYPAACWAPIWFNTHATPATNYAFSYPFGNDTGANDEIDVSNVAACSAAGGATCTLEWRPRNSSFSANLGTAGSGYYTGAGNVTVTKPNWATACPAASSPSDFRWNPPQRDTGTGEEVACTTCTGANGVLRAVESAAAGSKWRIVENARATPTGVYFHAGALNVEWDYAVPGAQSPLSGNLWPMMTLIVAGNLTTTNAKDIVLGTGTLKRFFPSLVVDGNFSTSNATQVALAGSMYVRGNTLWAHGNAGGSFIYGRVEVLGSFHMQGGSRVEWNYDVDLYAAGLMRFARAPRIGVPMGF